MTNDELASIFEASTSVCWPREGDYASLSGRQISSLFAAIDRARQAPAPVEVSRLSDEVYEAGSRHPAFGQLLHLIIDYGGACSAQRMPDLSQEERDHRGELRDEAFETLMAALRTALASTPAGEVPAGCVACEGKPAAENSPCAVCKLAAPSEPEAQKAVAWKPTESQILEAAEKAGLWPNTIHHWIGAFDRFFDALALATPTSIASTFVLALEESQERRDFNEWRADRMLSGEPISEYLDAWEAWFERARRTLAKKNGCRLGEGRG